MRTVFRIAGIVLGVFVVVIVAAALILPRVVDSDKIRAQVSALVKDKTGRDLVIAGHIGWSVFPWLGVEIGAVSLANTPGFNGQPLAKIASVQARVKLLPLLRREVEMSTLVLDGLQLHLIQTKDGRTNWDNLWPAGAEPKSRSDQRKETETEVAAVPVAAFAIGGVQVLNARVVMDDQAAGTQQSIDAINVQLGAIRPDQPVDVSLDFVAKTGKPVIESTLMLRGTVTPTDNYKTILLPDLTLNISAQGESLPNGSMAAKLAADLAYDTARSTFTLQRLTLDTLGLVLSGQMEGVGIGTEQTQFKGQLRLAQSRPREVLKRLGQVLPVTSDPAVLEKAEGEFSFQATPDSVQLTQLQLQLDESVLTGTLGMKHFAKPAIDFNLALDKLDLDRYLPPQTAAQAAAPSAVDDEDTEPEMASTDVSSQPAKKGKAPQRAADSLFPVDLLRDLNVNGRLKIGVLKAYQLRSSDVNVTISAKNGLVRVHPAQATMYQGSYSGDISIDVRGKRPLIEMNEKLRGVQAEPLLKDLLGEAQVTGSADVSLKLTATGNRESAIRKTLNGDVQFAFRDGVIKGLDVLGEIRSAYAMLRGKPAGAVAKQTEFSSITGTAKVVNGLVDNHDLSGKSPLMQVAGKGTANLVTQQLDYRVMATLVDSLEGKGELTGRPIPVHISGAFAAPKVRVDMEQVLKQEVQQQLQKKLQDTINSDTLKGLFKR